MCALLVNFISCFVFFWGGGVACVRVRLSADHLRVVHVPQQGISLRVQDKVSPLEAAAVLILLDVQKAAYTAQPVHVRHGDAITYHWETQMDRQTLQSAAHGGKRRTQSHIRQTRRINHHSLHQHTHTNTNTRICAEREEERDQLILSSFSCDTIEAEQQTLKPEAERRPPPQPKITDCAQDLHTCTFPLVGEERRRRGTCMRITQPLSPYPGLRWGGGGWWGDQRDSLNKWDVEELKVSAKTVRKKALRAQMNRKMWRRDIKHSLRWWMWLILKLCHDTAASVSEKTSANPQGEIYPDKPRVEHIRNNI